MRVLLVGINSKYIQTNLGIRYLKAYCEDIDGCSIEIKEFTVNQLIEDVMRDIYSLKPDILGISCYIWNVGLVIKLCRELKKVLPRIKIILGGPEVSYDARDIVNNNPFIDYVVRGEGEWVFKELVKNLIMGEVPYSIKGITFLNEEELYDNPPQEHIKELDMVPYPYEKGFDDLKNKLVYYEGSRGCPFNCEYCLSSTDKGVRYFSIDRVKEDLLSFINADIRIVKFVDRTFNCDRGRAAQIFKFLIDNRKKTSFHFEVDANTFDDYLIELVSAAPVGLFQFEIGIQTTNRKVLQLVNRRMDFKNVSNVIQKLQANRNIHLHLDLIAGLPMEGYDSFAESFNYVYELKPDRLQLGFLKLLKGSGIRNIADKYGYVFAYYPPYQVFSNNHISYEEINMLNLVENVVEIYYNSHGFVCSITYIISHFYLSPFDFFEKLGMFFFNKGYLGIPHAQESLYRILKDFYVEHINKDVVVFLELLRFDYIKRNRPLNLSDFFNVHRKPIKKHQIHDFLKYGKNISKYLSEFEGMAVKNIIKQVFFDFFSIDIECLMNENRIEYSHDDDVVVFNYMDIDLLGRAASHRVNINDF